MTAWWVLLATAAVVVAVGVTLRVRSGAVRTQPADGTGERLPDEVLALLARDAKDAVTLLQLSTTFCAPCRQARVLLADLAGRTPGLSHVELDLTRHPELVAPLRVRSTPTTLAVDATGVELLRLAGVPRREPLLAALRPHLPA